jgi:hypothetical protein
MMVSSSRSSSVTSRTGGVVEDRRRVHVVARQVAQQVLDDVECVLLVSAHHVGHAGLAVVRAGAPELLELHVLAGDGLDDVGTGDEHVGGLVDHHGEVGDRRGVDRAARARAHDQGDLWHDPGCVHVALEDLAIQAERHHTLLDAGAAGVVDADHRNAGVHRHIHDLDDLLAEDLAQAAPKTVKSWANTHTGRPSIVP